MNKIRIRQDEFGCWYLVRPSGYAHGFTYGRAAFERALKMADKIIFEERLKLIDQKKNRRRWLGKYKNPTIGLTRFSRKSLKA